MKITEQHFNTCEKCGKEYLIKYGVCPECKTMTKIEKIRYCRTVLLNNQLSQTFFLQILGVTPWTYKGGHRLEKIWWELALAQCQSIQIKSPSILKIT